MWKVFKQVCCTLKRASRKKKKKVFSFQKEKIIKDIRQAIKASRFDFS